MFDFFFNKSNSWSRENFWIVDEKVNLTTKETKSKNHLRRDKRYVEGIKKQKIKIKKGMLAAVFRIFLEIWYRVRPRILVEVTLLINLRSTFLAHLTCCFFYFFFFIFPFVLFFVLCFFSFSCLFYFFSFFFYFLFFVYSFFILYFFSFVFYPFSSSINP